MQVSPLPPPFLGTYSLLSLGCNTSCMVISFLVLWSICSTSSLVLFKNGHEYLTRRTAQVFIPLIRFLQNSFILSNYQVLKYSFLIFSFNILLFDGVSFQYPQVFVSFLFSERSNFVFIWLFHFVRNVYYYHYHFTPLRVVHTSVSRCFFHLRLSGSKTFPVSRTLLSILVDLNEAVVWMFFTCPLISTFFSPFTYPFGIVPSAYSTLQQNSDS